MAKFYVDPYLSVDGVALSDHVAEIEVKIASADLDVTGGGQAGTQRIIGKRDDSFSVTFLQDHASASVDPTLAGLVGGSLFVVSARPTTAAVGATNPSFSGTCILTDYTPIGGGIGDRAEAPVVFPVSGTITRATA